MPRNSTTGVFTRASNSFSNPIFGTLIDPTNADSLFDDYDTGLSIENFTWPVNVETVFNVRSYGANPINSAATNNVAFAAAVAAAAAVKGKVYVPAGTYAGNIVVQDLTGLTIEGDGAASIIVGPLGATVLDIFSNIGSGSVNNIVVRNIKVTGTGVGSIGLRIWNAFSFDVQDVYTSGEVGTSIQGSGIGNVTNLQAYGAIAGISLGNDAGSGLANVGPLTLVGGQYQTVGAVGPAILIKGDPLSVVFIAPEYVSNGGTHAASIIIDGDPTGTPVGSVSFIECHGESNYNSTNSGADYLIGSTHKFGSVKIIGGNSWGLGDAINYQQDFVKIVAARSVTIQGVTTSNLGNTGYSRSMIRLETTFPNVAAGDRYLFESNIYDGSGIMYSDANGRIGPNGADVSFNTTLIHSLALGTVLTAPFGGTGAASFTAHGILLGEGAGAITPTAAMTDGQLLVGQTGADPLPKTISGDWTISAAGVATVSKGATVAVTTNAPFFPLFVASSANGSQPFNLDTTFTYNPSTDTLTATNFAGNASTATSTTNSAITNDTTTNATMFPAWVTANTGNLPLKVTSTKLTFNPSTGILSSTGFVGTYNGNSFTTGTGTLTIAASKTLTASNTLTLTGTDGVTIPFGTRTQQTFISGSGTYTTPANVKYITARMVGGGGGGAGSGTSGGSGGNGTNSTFSTFTAGLGSGAVGATSGAGGTATGGRFNIPGTAGSGGTTNTAFSGSGGGSTPFGSAVIPAPNVAGQAAPTNSGAGGSGAGNNVTTPTGGGGGSGGYLEFLIVAPIATYLYGVGTGGAGGTAGTGGQAGGAGAAGVIIIDEFYQ